MAGKSIPNDIFQYSLISAFNAGLKEGGPPVAFLHNQGSHGIGIFEDMEEDSNNSQGDDMMLLNGTCYAIDSDGDVTVADEDDQTPFVMVTGFNPQQKVSTPGGTSSEKIKQLFEKVKNTPVPFRVTGKFKYISTRQQTYWDVSGTICGFCVPTWQSQMSGEGLQGCFIDDRKKHGGKVNDFETAEGATLEWARCGRLHMGFPQDEEFDQLRLMNVTRKNTMGGA